MRWRRASRWTNWPARARSPATSSAPNGLRLVPVEAEGLAADEIERFRSALIRTRQRNGLFSAEPGTVSFLGDALFRTRIVFPANVPPGDYQVQVLQLADGEVTGAQTSTLEIAKMGIEADLFDFSLHRPALYALASIVLAVTAGWSGQRAVSQAMTDE